MEKQALATIIVTPRERYSIVTRTLECLYNNTPKDYPVIYIAGGATSSVSQYLSTTCEKYGYELILKPAFLTPNMARNIGIVKATTKYIVFIENDVVVEKGWIEALIQCAEEENADCVSPLCLIGEPANLYVHSFGGKLVFENTETQSGIREAHHCGPICLRTDPRQLTRIASDYSEFHCALLKRSVLTEIGLLDKNIKGAAEHIDLALHLQKLKCRGFSEPNAIVSYLPSEYKMADLATYKLRWSDEWHYPTMKHLAEKWSLSTNAPLFSDYHASFIELRERCLLKQEWSPDKLPSTEDNLIVAHTFTQLIQQMTMLGYSQDAQSKIQNAYKIACELFAASFRASGNTFISHLVGTSSILVAFGAAPALISAALLHAALQQGRFPAHVENILAMRRWLRRRVGYAVENLVYQYSWLKLEDITQYQADNFNELPIEMANAILIRMANAIEDRIHDNKNVNPPEWLEKSNARIDTWMDTFTAIAKQLDANGLAIILKNILAKSRVNQHENKVTAIHTSNYYIQTETGTVHALDSRNIVSPKADDLMKPKNVINTVSYNMNIKNICAWNGSNSRISYHSDHVRLVFDPKPWSYSAYLPIQKNPAITKEQKVTIDIMLQTECGNIGILFLERNSTLHVLTPEQSIAETNEPVKIKFEIDSLDEAENIVFRSWPNDKGQAIAKIYSVNVR